MAALDSVTADEFGQWLTPNDALDAIKSVMDFQQGCAAITTLLRFGVVRAAGKQFYIMRGAQEEGRGEFGVVPANLWKANWASNWQSAFWISGQVEFEPSVDARYGPRLKYTFLGLRFEPKVVLELAPTAIGDQEGEPEPSPPRHAGGRPRKDFWEPLLVAAGIAIYAGWQPQRIADVERWMADWLADNEHEAAEVGIRQRARILFNAYAAERDKN